LNQAKSVQAIDAKKLSSDSSNSRQATSTLNQRQLQMQSRTNEQSKNATKNEQQQSLLTQKTSLGIKKLLQD